MHDSVCFLTIRESLSLSLSLEIHILFWPTLYMSRKEALENWGEMSSYTYLACGSVQGQEDQTFVDVLHKGLQVVTALNQVGILLMSAEL